MFINRLSLKDYRNITSATLELTDGVNIFFGKNGNGKTNLLESVYICSTGRSHRTHNDKELIGFGCESAHIQLYVNKSTITDRIDVHLKKDEKKGVAINNLPIKKLGELFGILNVVIFTPEDLQLIKAGPSERRRFMDIELCQMSRLYYYDLQQYHKILKQRNNLLKTLQKDSRLKDTLFVWDEQLSAFGIKLIRAREEFVKDINVIAGKIHSDLTGGLERLNIAYKKSVSEEDFKIRLEKSLEKDIFTGNTSYGPHKDDIIFSINSINTREYGSQGQQRCAALSAKLAEIELIKSKMNRRPVLLLDDVLSELDKDRQNYLVSTVKNIQTIITCTHVDDIIKKMSANSKLFYVENGKIEVKNT